jgi:hypothetical protein
MVIKLICGPQDFTIVPEFCGISFPGRQCSSILALLHATSICTIAATSWIGATPRMYFIIRKKKRSAEKITILPVLYLRTSPGWSQKRVLMLLAVSWRPCHQATSSANQRSNHDKLGNAFVSLTKIRKFGTQVSRLRLLISSWTTTTIRDSGGRHTSNFGESLLP